MSQIVIGFLLFCLGAGIGSFVGALSSQKGQGSKKAKRSRCDSCRHKLAARDLCPIFSWLALAGKCRYCHKKITPKYFFVEALLGSLFTLSYLIWPAAELNGPLQIGVFVLWLVILSGLVALSLCDIETKKLPNQILYPVLTTAAIFWVLSNVENEHIFYSQTWLELLYAMLPIAGLYGFIYVISKGKLIGLGDVKLGLVVGFLLTWQSSVLVICLANIIALIACLAVPKLRRNQKIAFGPMLIASLILVFLCDEIFRGLLLGVGL